MPHPDLMSHWLQRFPHALLSAAVVAALTACGGGGESGKDTDTQASKAGTAATVKAQALPDNSASPTSTTVNIMASGSAAIGVFPEMELRVDGRVLGRATVTSPQVRVYPFVVTPAIAPGARIDVAYVNDAVINGEDRNLVVRSIEVAGQTQMATAPTVVYDLGAVDDIDVIPGRAEMDWNGALRFTMHQTEFVYHDEAPFLAFDNQQLQVSSKGDIFLTWHATHKTAEGVIDGTDVNVIQRDATTHAWHRTTIANVPFPNAGGGFIYNQKIMALPQGDMIACWDVVDIPAYNASTFNRPPQVYSSRYSAVQNQWSTPQAIPGDYAIYSFNNGWALLPAGDGRLLMLWQTKSQGLYGRFYSSVDSTWSTPQDIPLNTNSPLSGWQVDSSFNRSGTGMVQMNQTTAYYDAAHQIWSAATFVPPEGAYFYNVYRSPPSKPFAVDEDGNVFSALVERGAFKLWLSKWSAQTRQIEWTQSVEPVTSAFITAHLDLQTDGGLLTWVDSDESLLHKSLRFVQLNKEGLIQGQRQMGPPILGAYYTNLQTRTTAAGKTYAMWSHYQCTPPRPTGCPAVIQISTFLPGQGWSTPQSIPSWVGFQIPFEVNPSGAAALAMPALTKDYLPDSRFRIDVSVMALN